MKTVLGSGIWIILGLGLIIFRKWYAREIIEFQNRTFGFHYGEKAVVSAEWVILLCGFLFIVSGLSTIFCLGIPLP